MLKSLTIALSVCVLKGLVVRADKDNIVVNNLRKQLMQENYDYTLESNETETVNMRADVKPPLNKSKNEFNKIYVFNYTSEKKESNGRIKKINQIEKKESQDKHVTTKFDNITRSNVDDSQMSYEKEVDKTYKSALEQPISMKDLLYYMDEEKLLKDKLDPETRELNARRSLNYEAADKKYKLLKVRHQYRRNNPGRFIQEEGNNGVVIINLDNGTFPEFRLPRNRRQYMHDHGEMVVEEGEVPPPPISSYLSLEKESDIS